MFSCEYCETFKNSFFYRTSLVAAFGIETFFSFWCITLKFIKLLNLWIFLLFFQIAISLLAYVVTFSGQLYFGRSYFFTLFQSTSTQQLFFRGSYFFTRAAVFSFFRTVTFSEELFLQNSLFSERKFYRVATSWE